MRYERVCLATSDQVLIVMFFHDVISFPQSFSDTNIFELLGLGIEIQPLHRFCSSNFNYRHWNCENLVGAI